MTSKKPSAPRCAALVGPYLSGKTTLLESILFTTGAANRKGSIKEGNTVGDASPEARARQMSSELSIATTEYLNDQWTFIDCPGSVELLQDAINTLMVVDAAVIVCEASAEKALTVAPLLRFLGEHKIPHFIFINKMDVATSGVKQTLEALQAYSDEPLVLREIPIRNGEHITGHVDLASERAFKWISNSPSELIELPETTQDREQEARDEMLESLADFDDSLLEALLEDVTPSSEETYNFLTNSLKESQIVPVFFGSAEHDNGVRRLLKALRHETPEPTETAARIGIESEGSDPLARVFKTVHGSHTGKLSFTRVWRGEISDGMTLDGGRVSGLFHMLGQKQNKIDKAGVGEIVGLGRMDEVSTGAVLSVNGGGEAGDWPQTISPLFSLSVHAEKRADDVKLTGSLAKLVEEDPSLSFGSDSDTGELLIWGQGDLHLQIALDRLRNRYNLDTVSQPPQVPYKETIRKSITHHARHKKQSGGHGQFGDVHLEIKPLPRGSGFKFDNSITGGVVPKQYFPAVENGVKEYMNRGPLGFLVVDISVTLTDGQYHTVDSSEMAFKAAAMLAMREAMPKCNPVLLEPIFQVELSMPNEFTSKVQRLVSGRRGQILGFDAKPGWKNWDEVSVQLPQSEMHDLIVDLRSLTLGVGFFQWKFDHQQEFTGKQADQVVAARAEKNQ